MSLKTQPRFLATGCVEILGVEPSLEVLLSCGPFFIEQREPRCVAIAPFDDHDLAEGALVGKAEADGGVAGRCVECVAFPLKPAVAQFVKYAGHQQEDGFGRGGRSFE